MCVSVGLHFWRLRRCSWRVPDRAVKANHHRLHGPRLRRKLLLPPHSIRRRPIRSEAQPTTLRSLRRCCNRWTTRSRSRILELESMAAGSRFHLTMPTPQGETIELWVSRHRTTSSGRIGVLFANNGGPGFPASFMAAGVRTWFGDPLIERFDVVSWDPRGTGLSGGSVDCISDGEYDRYFASSDITPETDIERQALVRPCARVCRELRRGSWS